LLPQAQQLCPLRKEEAFSEADRFSIADPQGLREASSRAHRVLPDSFLADRVRSIRHAPDSQALADLAALRAVVPDLGHGPGLAHRDRVDLADNVPAVPERVHLRVKLHVRSVRQGARAVATSSIRRPKKVR
jgi:hypothetical protein